MRRTTYLAGMLLAASTMLACRQPTASQQNPPADPVPAAVQTEAAPQQPDTAIDQSVSANVGDPAKLRETLSTLQEAVRKHDAAAVAALVNYPITINPHTPTTVIIRTPATFVARYDQIITPHVADVIEQQKYADLFVNYQGAMLGNGELWIAGICRDKTCTQTDIKIKTIQNTSGKPK
jgi:hypothetical protein